MARHPQRDSLGIAPHQVAQWKVLAIRHKPSGVPGPGCRDSRLLMAIKPSKRWHGRICVVEGNDQPLGDRASLQLNQSQHGLIIARVAREPPHTLGCMSDDASALKVVGGALFVKPGQGDQSSSWADSTFR